MFNWMTKIFSAKQQETLELSDEEKKRSSDDLMSQSLFFTSANHALHPSDTSDASDAGSGDGGGSVGD